MENASKALIIAGAILLAILLISLGILIFNQAQDTVNNSGMSQAEIAAFNNKFVKYEGKSQSGSVAKSVINEVLASNADSNNSERRIVIWLNGSAITSTSSIDIKAKYDINVTIATATNSNEHYTKGCVQRIELTKK